MFVCKFTKIFLSVIQTESSFLECVWRSVHLGSITIKSLTIIEHKTYVCYTSADNALRRLIDFHLRNTCVRRYCMFEKWIGFDNSYVLYCYYSRAREKWGKRYFRCTHSRWKNIIIIIVNDLTKEHEQWQWWVVVVGGGGKQVKLINAKTGVRRRRRRVAGQQPVLAGSNSFSYNTQLR